jgi:hypothetical protein
MKYDYSFQLKIFILFPNLLFEDYFLLNQKITKGRNLRDSQLQGYRLMNMPVLKKRYVNDSWFMAPKAQVLEREVLSYNVSECKVYFESFDSTLLALKIF